MPPMRTLWTATSRAAYCVQEAVRTCQLPYAGASRRKALECARDRRKALECAGEDRHATMIPGGVLPPERVMAVHRGPCAGSTSAATREKGGTGVLQRFLQTLHAMEIHSSTLRWTSASKLHPEQLSGDGRCHAAHRTGRHPQLCRIIGFTLQEEASWNGCSSQAPAELPSPLRASFLLEADARRTGGEAHWGTQGF